MHSKYFVHEKQVPILCSSRNSSLVSRRRTLLDPTRTESSELEAVHCDLRESERVVPVAKPDGDFDTSKMERTFTIGDTKRSDREWKEYIRQRAETLYSKQTVQENHAPIIGSVGSSSLAIRRKGADPGKEPKLPKLERTVTISDMKRPDREWKEYIRQRAELMRGKYAVHEKQAPILSSPSGSSLMGHRRILIDRIRSCSNLSCSTRGSETDLPPVSPSVVCEGKGVEPHGVLETPKIERSLTIGNAIRRDRDCQAHPPLCMTRAETRQAHLPLMPYISQLN